MTTSELATAVKMVCVIVDKNGKHNGVRLEADTKHKRMITLGAHAERGDAVGEIDAAIEGESFTVSLQAPYLLQLVDRVTSVQLAIEFLKNEPQPAPVVIRSVGDDDFLYVMMPLIETRAEPKKTKEKVEKEQPTEAEN